MFHLDVKKGGKIPDGGGWWARGLGNTQALASKRAHKPRVGYTYFHSAVDGFSRLACIEALEDETSRPRTPSLNLSNVTNYTILP